MCRQEKICKETGEEEELKVPHLQHPVDESAAHPITPLLQQITPTFQQQQIVPVFQQQQIAPVFQQQQYTASSARSFFTHPFTAIVTGPTNTGRSAQLSRLLADSSSGGRILFDIPSPALEIYSDNNIRLTIRIRCPGYHIPTFHAAAPSNYAYSYEGSLARAGALTELEGETLHAINNDGSVTLVSPTEYALARAVAGSHSRTMALLNALNFSQNRTSSYIHVGSRELRSLLIHGEGPIVSEQRRSLITLFSRMQACLTEIRDTLRQAAKESNLKRKIRQLATIRTGKMEREEATLANVRERLSQMRLDQEERKSENRNRKERSKQFSNSNKIRKHRKQQQQQHQKPRNRLCCWRNMH